MPASPTHGPNSLRPAEHTLQQSAHPSGRRSRAALTALLLGAELVHPSQAMAQLSDDALAPLTSVGKRPAALADRPANIVLNAAQLQERGATSLEDLLAGVPGVQVNPGEPGQALPTLRGIGTSASSAMLGTQQATTGIYVDDVPLTSPFGFVGTPDLSDFSLSRLEVMRGPQGVLYGSASLGGAIQYVMRKPAQAQQRASLHAAVNLPSTGGVGTLTRAEVDLPFANDAAALRLEAFRRMVPGYIHNLGTGQNRANTVRREGVRAAARWWMQGGTVVDTALLQQNQQRDDTAAASPDVHTLEINTPSASRFTDRFSLARVQVDTPLAPSHTLSAITALVHQQVDGQDDLSRSSGALGVAYGPALGLGPLPVLPLVQSIKRSPTRNRLLSQELRVAARDASGQGYVAGLFVQTAAFDNDSASIAPGGQALWGDAGFLLPNGELGALKLHARTQESALFGEVHLHGPGHLGISLGGRAYRTSLAYDAALRFLGQTTAGSAKRSESGFIPRLGLRLPMGPHALFATVAGGFRFGGVNFNPPTLTPYRSDRLLNHEVGLRLQPNDRLQVDLTVFLIDWRNAQVSTLLGGPLPTIGVANVGQARSTGVEAAWQWRGPTGFDMCGALSGTDAHTVADFTTAQGHTLPAGARLPGTARWQTQFSLGYSFDAAQGWLGRAVLSHAWVGSRVFDIEGSAKAPAYARLNVSLSMTRGPWDLSGHIHNLTNVKGVAGAAFINRPDVANFTDWYVVPPRSVGLALSRGW